MKTPGEILGEILKEEEMKISSSFHGSSFYAMQFLIRAFDVQQQYYEAQESLNSEDLINKEFLRFGWPIAIRKFYDKIQYEDSFHHDILVDRKDLNWAWSTLLFAGKLGFTKQVIDNEKPGLSKITQKTANEFAYEFASEHVGVEYFDKLSEDFYREKVIEKWIKDEQKKHVFDLDRIKNEVESVIENPLGQFISYTTNAEIDAYYNQEARYHMQSLNSIDDFGPNDSFGSIEYSKYLDFVELQISMSLMHYGACMALRERNPQVNIYNILSYSYPKNKTLETYANYFGHSKKEMQQILSCVTISNENYLSYLSKPAVTSPMYFQLGNNTLIRTVTGCLSNPIKLLNSELKRRFEKDYFIAVNNREDRFRNELFSFLEI